jgi:hypothetical protein
MKILREGSLTERQEVDLLFWQDGERESNDQEWEAVLEVLVHLEGPADYRDAAEIILKSRRAQRSALGGRSGVRPHRPLSLEPIEEPQHWRRSCEALFASFADEAAEVRLVLGLKAPLPIEKLHDFLEEFAKHERQGGDLDHIDYLDPPGNPRRLMFRRGYTVEEYLDLTKSGKLQRLPGRPPRDETGGEPQETPMLVSDWLAARASRLCQVADKATDLSKQTGCSDAEATVFLLCDRVPELPWLRGMVHSFDSPRRHAFVIEIGSPHVSAEDVRRFYVQLREVAEQSAGSLNSPHRARRSWTYEMFDFVEDHSRGGWSWQDIFEEWNEKQPEQPYKSVAGMRRSFYEAKKRARKGGFFESSPRVYEPRKAKPK